MMFILAASLGSLENVLTLRSLYLSLSLHDPALTPFDSACCLHDLLLVIFPASMILLSCNATISIAWPWDIGLLSVLLLSISCYSHLQTVLLFSCVLFDFFFFYYKYSDLSVIPLSV